MNGAHPWMPPARSSGCRVHDRAESVPAGQRICRRSGWRRICDKRTVNRRWLLLSPHPSATGLRRVLAQLSAEQRRNPGQCRRLRRCEIGSLRQQCRDLPCVFHPQGIAPRAESVARIADCLAGRGCPERLDARYSPNPCSAPMVMRRRIVSRERRLTSGSDRALSARRSSASKNIRCVHFFCA